MGQIEPRTFMLRDGTTLVVRTPVESDTPALFAHARHMAATSEHTVVQPDEMRDEDGERQRLLDLIAAGHSLTLVACVGAGGPIAGELTFRGHPRRRMAHHGSFGIGIAEPWRGRGVGRALIVSLLDWGVAHPVLEKVTLGVFGNNDGARRLYARLGFVEESRQQRFFKIGPGRYVDDIVMAVYVKPGIAPEGFNTYTPGSLT